MVSGPCWDVYVWVGVRPDIATEFLLDHVDLNDPRNHHFCIDGADTGPATIYLKGREYGVIVSHTLEDDMVTHRVG